MGDRQPAPVARDVAFFTDHGGERYRLRSPTRDEVLAVVPACRFACIRPNTYSSVVRLSDGRYGWALVGYLGRVGISDDVFAADNAIRCALDDRPSERSRVGRPRP